MYELNISKLIESEDLIAPIHIYISPREQNAKVILLSILLYNHVLKIDGNNIKVILINVSEACSYLRATKGSLCCTLKKLEKLQLIKILNVEENYIKVFWLYKINSIYDLEFNENDYEEYE